MKRTWLRSGLAIMLSTVMVLGMAGCGGKDQANETTASVPVKKESTESTMTGDISSGETVYDFSDKEQITLKLYMFGEADTAQCEAVSEELSKITREKLNCNVELTRIGFGSYVSQMNLLLSSGEQVDVFNAFSINLSTMANSGQIRPMRSLLETVGKETYGAISESDWACTTIGDDIYMIPPNKDKAYSLGFMMRKDILDELGISVEEIQSFEDLHDVLVQVKEAHPDMYPVVPDFQNVMGMYAIDALNDSLGVLLDPYGSNELKVENFYASSYYYDLCEMMYSWAQEGLIMPDASTNTESSDILMKSGKGFGHFSHMKVGFDAESSNSIGTEIVSWVYKEPISNTTKISAGMCIGENTIDEERAMALIDLMYNDPDVSNLCINGIEGVHYVFVDKEKGIIDYPEGKDATTVGYSRQAWGWPNEQISYLRKGDSLTLWQDLNAFNQNAIQSPAKGFTFDNSKVLNEVTACQNVSEKYHRALIAGQLDPAVTIPKFLDELDRAGIDTIIKEKQAQLDAWAGKQ